MYRLLHISKQEGFGDILAAIANLNLNLLAEVRHDVHHCVYIYMGREGFEPPKAEPTDLQSVSINHSDTYPNSPTSIRTRNLRVNSSLLCR